MYYEMSMSDVEYITCKITAFFKNESSRILVRPLLSSKPVEEEIQQRS
jgi:hypothetical protein